MDHLSPASPSKLEHLCRTDRYCDVTIRIEGRCFACHRVILASASEFFDTMFGGDFRERNAQEIDLHDIDVDIFEKILRCVYNIHEFEYVFTVRNIYKLLSASLFLLIHSLKMKCIIYIAQNISSIQDHVPILVLARTMDLTTLADIVGEYIVKHFRLFYDNAELLRVAVDDLTFLLHQWSRHDSIFKCESLMLHLLIRWICYDLGERRKYSMSLVGMVDFKKLAPDYVSFVWQHFDGEFGQQLFEKCQLNLNLRFSEGYSSAEDANRSLLQNKLIDYFGDEKLSADSDIEIPDTFHKPTFYKDVLGIHLYVEYCKTYGTADQFSVRTEHLRDTKILSLHEYYPKWFVSGTTDAWYDCLDRFTVLQESNNLLYCMEILEHNRSPTVTQQVFRAYSSIDMKSFSRVLASPFIHWEKGDKINMCATPIGNIYLLDSSKRQNDYAMLHSYDCNLNQWSAVHSSEYGINKDACLSVERNLLYCIGGGNTNIVQALDSRFGRWMKLPSCIEKYACCDSESHTLNGKVFVSDGVFLESYDTVAGKWETIDLPFDEGYMKKMLPYGDHLMWLIKGVKAYKSNDGYQLMSYRPNFQDWYVLEKSLNQAMYRAGPRINDSILWEIRDMITFKM